MKNKTTTLVNPRSELLFSPNILYRITEFRMADNQQPELPPTEEAMEEPVPQPMEEPGPQPVETPVSAEETASAPAPEEAPVLPPQEKPWYQIFGGKHRKSKKRSRKQKGGKASKKRLANKKSRKQKQKR